MHHLFHSGRERNVSAPGARMLRACRKCGECSTFTRTSKISFPLTFSDEMWDLLGFLERNRCAAALQVQLIKLVLKMRLGKGQHYRRSIDAYTEQKKAGED